MPISNAEIKVKVIKFLEIAYNTDDKLTTYLVKDKDKVTLNVDNKGNATLVGSAGKLKFSVADELTELGLNFRFASILFSGNKQGMINYRASFGTPIEVSVSGFIDVEQLLLSCSGLLCIAARAMKNRFEMIDKSIAEQTLSP